MCGSLCVMALQMSLASLPSEMWPAWDVEWSFFVVVAGVQGLHRAGQPLAL